MVMDEDEKNAMSEDEDSDASYSRRMADPSLSFPPPPSLVIEKIRIPTLSQLENGTNGSNLAYSLVPSSYFGYSLFFTPPLPILIREIPLRMTKLLLSPP